MFVDDFINCELPDASPVGLTKRELFAAMAMQGFVSADDYQHVMLGQGYQLSDFAAASVRIADALLAELAKEQS